MRTKILLTGLFIVLGSWMATSAFADPIQRVVIVDTDNVSRYVQQIERGKAILARLGSTAILRVFQGTFAGSEAGAVVVTVEYASLADMAKEQPMVAADREYSSWLAGLDSIRTIISDSIYNEL